MNVIRAIGAVGLFVFVSSVSYAADCSNYIYYKSGRTFKSGSYLYHENGQTLKSGSYLYHPNGQTLKSGSYFYHGNGQTAKSGSYLYDKEGQSISGTSVSISLQLGHDSRGLAIVNRKSETMLQVDGVEGSYLITKDGDFSCGTSEEPLPIPGEDCPTYLYHPDGQTLKSGSYLYHANGQTLKSGSYLYHPNGQTLKSGSYFYHGNGQTAKSGSYFYDENGQSVSTPQVSIRLGAAGDNAGVAAVDRDSDTILRLSGAPAAFLISKDGQLRCF